MKKYKVIEERISVIEHEIEAESLEAAEKCQGEILSSFEIDNYFHDLVSCEEI